VLWSLLGVSIGAWGAQFIGNWTELGAFISNHAVHGITARLELSDWFQLQLTIQKMPHRLGDAIGALNLKNLLQHH